jgi:hypothetical protein
MPGLNEDIQPICRGRREFVREVILIVVVVIRRSKRGEPLPLQLPLVPSLCSPLDAGTSTAFDVIVMRCCVTFGGLLVLASIGGPFSMLRCFDATVCP